MPYAELPDTTGDLEEEVLELWRREDTFGRSLEEREGEPEFVFYEGPPTANGRPGVHHIMARTIKDLVARFRTMTGHHVTRIAGWDTHGLPVELEAEKQLGISGKPEIEELGIAEFNRVCRENIFTYKDEWERLSRRIGYWLDYDHPYITYSRDYIESVWWAVSEIDARGLLYRGHKVLPYCPRCGTGLSSHEVAQGYEDRTDPSLYSLFPLREDAGEAEDADADAPAGNAERSDAPRRHLLLWTTTPWTLVSNVTVAYGPDVEYVEVEARPASDGENASAGEAPIRVIVSRRRAEALVEEEERGAARFAYRITREALEDARAVSVEELEGLVYERPLRLLPEAEAERLPPGRLYPAGFVSDEEGTGFVHIAPAFGADDFELGREHDLPVIRPVDDEGRFEADVEEVGGVPVKEADERLIERLAERGRLFAAGRLRHSYPHCWRCDSPLLYMARDSWYVRTTAVKDELLAANRSVSWHPPEIGSGRMGEWLENNVDWALSRDRYWGTPLPIWECGRDAAHREVIGSYERLEERAGGLPEDFDPHRPGIDELTWACPEEGCEGEMRRAPQVLDAWFDSGSMPYAQWHYPFENEDAFRAHYPADFIAEGVDQTRGWFYSLLALSTLLFEEPAYRSVVVNDLILDASGQKMSKSRGNAVDPWEAIEEHGADAIRFYLMASSNPWLPKRWDPEGLREVDRKFFDTLRNSYRFFAMYANLEGWTHETAGQGDGEAAGSEGAAGQDDGAAAEAGAEAIPPPRPWGERSETDRWLLSRLDTLSGQVRDDLEAYDLTRAARRLSTFVSDELSNWYVRRSRDRFWATRGRDDETSGEPDAAAPDGPLQGTADAFATMREALRTTSLLLAPFAPFLSDWLHRQVTGGRSAHLAEFPGDEGRRDAELEREMGDVRELAALGRAAREETGIRVRQPLRTLQVVLPGGRGLSEPLVGLLREELNVKRVVFLDESHDLVRLTVKPRFGQLGPRYEADTPAVARSVEGLGEDAARRLRSGESVTVTADGREAEIRPDDVTILEEARGELAVQSGGGYLAALDPGLDEDLLEEGLARELVSRVQRLRRDAGLEVADRIELAISGTPGVRKAAAAHRDYIAGETLAVRLDLHVTDETGEEAFEPGGAEHVAEMEIDGNRARVGLSRTSTGA